MRYFIRVFFMDLRRCFLQKRFWLCTLFVFITLVLTPGYIIKFGDVDVLMLCCMGMTQSASFIVVTGLLPLFAYTGSYAVDFKQKTVIYYTIRSGVKRYAISKYVSAILGGMLVFGVGMLLSALIFSFRYPFYSASYASGDGYFVLVENGSPFLYFLLFILHYMLSAACFSATGFFVSAWIPEAFTTYTLPMILYFIFQRFGGMLPIPLWTMPGNLIQGIFDLGSPAKTFCLRATVIILYCLVLGVISVIVIERRSRRS